MRSWKVDVEAVGLVELLALITGGMKAPSDGALKITIEIFSSVWAWDGCAAATAMISAATRGK